MKYHEQNCFVTLTYDDEHLRNCPLLDNIKHPKYPGTLLKNDLQLYFKRLRKAGYNFKYVACGEYGEENFRPHYHIIFFGIGIACDVFRVYSGSNDIQVNEQVKHDLYWKKGIVDVGTCTKDSIRYTVDYIQKSLNGELGRQEYAGVEPPFQLVSKGLGKQFFLDNDHLHNRDYITVNGNKVSMPRYYKKVIGTDGFLNFKHLEYNKKLREKYESRGDFNIEKRKGEEQQERNLKAKSAIKKRNLERRPRLPVDTSTF
jgi:hypothetical protein